MKGSKKASINTTASKRKGKEKGKFAAECRKGPCDERHGKGQGSQYLLLFPQFWASTHSKKMANRRPSRGLWVVSVQWTREAESCVCSAFRTEGLAAVHDCLLGEYKESKSQTWLGAAYG